MTQKKSYRIAQVNRLLREEIAKIILTELQDERTNEISITEVRASKDLKHATVFVSTHVQGKGDEYTVMLQDLAAHIRRILYPRLHLKHIPELHFQYDVSLDQAERIFQTLQEIDLGTEEENLGTKA
jgi:ribosome-binding factor A